LLKYINRLQIKIHSTITHDRIIQEAKTLFIHTNERGKTIAYELGLENEVYVSKFLKSQQVSVRENSQKKCASKSMICAFLDNGTLLL
jgi:AraC-like DNA-binding protein